MAATIDEVLELLDANADFEAAQSVSKAQAFLTATTKYLFLVPQSQSDQGSSLAISPATVENLANRARNFIAANRTPSSTVRFLSVSEGFR
jgi:hypothetical protein